MHEADPAADDQLIDALAEVSNTRIVKWHACLDDRQLGYELEAWSEDTGECWRVRACCLEDAVRELALLLGFELA